MRRPYIALALVASVLLPASAHAQRVAEQIERLSFRFEQPNSTPLEHARDGLHVLDGEFVAMGRMSTDSIAEIIARVRPATWLRNPEVVGNVPGMGTDERVTFGRLQAYLRGDHRFRILVIPAMCAGCEGDRLVMFLPYADTTGYVVGGPARGQNRRR